MSLAILLDAEGEGPDAPIFRLGDRSAIRLDNGAEAVDQAFDLLRRDILTRQKNMLVERHVPFLLTAPVQSLTWAFKKERPK